MYVSIMECRNNRPVYFEFQEDLVNGEDVATCPSCSLLLKVIYDADQFQEDTETVTIPTQVAIAAQ